MERNKVYAVEGLDGTGKTTAAKMLAEQTNNRYFYWSENNLLAPYRKKFDNANPKTRFVYYTLAAVDTYFRVNKLRESSDVYVDRTIASTIAYHKALGVPDSWISVIPKFLVNQLDSMLYFTAEDHTRLERMQERQRREGKKFTDLSDQKSLENGRIVDQAYRQIMPERTIFIATDNKQPQEVVDELKSVLYPQK